MNIYEETALILPKYQNDQLRKKKKIVHLS